MEMGFLEFLYSAFPLMKLFFTRTWLSVICIIWDILIDYCARVICYGYVHLLRLVLPVCVSHREHVRIDDKRIRIKDATILAHFPTTALCHGIDKAVQICYPSYYETQDRFTCTVIKNLGDCKLMLEIARMTGRENYKIKKHAAELRALRKRLDKRKMKIVSLVKLFLTMQVLSKEVFRNT